MVIWFPKQTFKIIVTAAIILVTAANFCTTSAIAATDHLLITEVQTQSTSSTTDEFIEIYNPSGKDVSLLNFDVVYKSASGSTSAVLALSPALGDAYLQAHSFLLLTRSSYNLSSDATFTSGLNESGGHISIRLDGSVVDTVGWGTATAPEAQSAAAAPKGSTLSRKSDLNGLFQDTDNNLADFIQSAASPHAGGVVEIVTDICPNIPGAQAAIPAGYTVDTAGSCVPIIVDMCPNLPDVQVSIPERYGKDATGNCTIVQECRVQISEISSQANLNGQEYVELTNASSQTMWLKYCSLRINGNTMRVLADLQLLSGARTVVSFSSGTIRNSAGVVTLIDSTDAEADYSYPETTSGQVVNFASNTFVGTVSSTPTPGFENSQSIVTVSTPEDDTVTLDACPAGKYRNPDTNRCKNISIANAVLAACDDGQERNPDTNRCRKIATISLASCDEGQERNSATNRCRKSSPSNTDPKPCAPGQERNQETNRCRKMLASTPSSVIGASAQPAKASRLRIDYKIASLVLAAVLLYAAYEYRVDMRNLLDKWRVEQETKRLRK